jgi:ABC-type transporter Mla MlaB component
LEAATLTLNGEEEFDLTDEDVAIQIALYLLEGTSPQDFLKGKEAVEASYTAEATNEDGITFTLEGELVFKVAEPTQDEIDAAKAAFLNYLEGKVEDIEVADVEIVGEDITVTFDRDTTPSAVYQAANELVAALKGELDAATLTLNGEEEFDLTDADVAIDIALYLLEGTSPQDFLKGKEAVEASYTAEATNEDGITFTLEGELVFKVAEPTQDEIDAAKAAFLDYLEGKVEDIEVADVEIVGEDITVTFDRDTTPSAVYQAANELVAALKGELDAATLTLNGEEEFDLTDADVAIDIALYLLEGTSPQDFLKGKEAVEASYTAEATNEDGITFTLEGELVFKVAEPTQDEIDAAKAAFLADLKDKVEDIEVADVEIVGEDITVTFDRDTTPSAVYQAANELVAALKGELDAATLTLNGEEEFDLTDADVAIDIALYLLEGTSPQDFLKGKEAVEASYTAEATNEDGITFTLEGELVFKVAEPTQDEIDAAKAAFLADLKDKVKDIDVAAVAIDGEDITVTFDRDANPAEVYQAANELVDALKGELEAATLTLNEDETDGRFDLTDEGVAAQIALYLLDGTSPTEFLKGLETIEASYTAEAIDQDGIPFTLEGELVFQMEEDYIEVSETVQLDRDYDKVNVVGNEIEVDLGGYTAQVLTVNGNNVTLKNGTIINLTIAEGVENVTLEDISDSEDGTWIFAGGGSDSIIFKGRTAPKGTILITSPTPIEIRSESEDSEIVGNVIIETVTRVIIDTPVQGDIEVQAATESITVKRPVRKITAFFKTHIRIDHRLSQSEQPILEKPADVDASAVLIDGDEDEIEEIEFEENEISPHLKTLL